MGKRRAWREKSSFKDMVCFLIDVLWTDEFQI